MAHETNFWFRCLAAWLRIFVTFICHKLFYVIITQYIENGEKGEKLLAKKDEGCGRAKSQNGK